MVVCSLWSQVRADSPAAFDPLVSAVSNAWTAAPVESTSTAFGFSSSFLLNGGLVLHLVVDRPIVERNAPARLAGFVHCCSRRYVAPASITDLRFGLLVQNLSWHAFSAMIAN